MVGLAQVPTLRKRYGRQQQRLGRVGHHHQHAHEYPQQQGPEEPQGHQDHRHRQFQELAVRFANGTPEGTRPVLLRSWGVGRGYRPLVLLSAVNLRRR